MSLRNWILTFAIAIALYLGAVIAVPQLVGKADADPKTKPDTPKTAISEKTEAPAQENREFQFPAPVLEAGDVPYFLEETVISASLDALKKHGSDLTKPMPSTHRVRCESDDAVKKISAWAAKNGFKVEPPKTVHLHGGIENFTVDLVKTEIPSLPEIQAAGREISTAVADTEGATYASWIGAIVR